MSFLEILLNGKTKRVEENTTLTELLKMLHLQSSLVAVEINREILPKKDYDSYVLKGGDQLEIVQILGGG